MTSSRIEKWFYAALVLLVAFFAWMVFAPYMGVLILAATLAIIMRPVYRGMVRGVRSEMLAALLCVLLVTVIIFIPVVYFGFRIVGEASGLYQTLSAHGGFDFGPAVHQFLTAHFPNASIPNFTLNFNSTAQSVLAWFAQNLGSLFTSLAQILFVAFLALFGMYYVLKDGAKLKEWIVEYIPFERADTEQIVHETESVMKSVVGGTLAMAVIQGIVVGVGFLLFGIPNPAFWGALTVLATLIPIIGTWLVVIPAIGYLFFTGHGTMAFGFAVWSIVLVNLVFNVLSPQIIHRGSNIHPFIILLAVIGGISAFGPIGFLIGPFIVALLFALLRVYPRIVE